MATSQNATVPELRQKLQSMTNDRFNVFLQDYYSEVWAAIGDEQSRARKETYLLDFCIRKPNELARLTRCLNGVEPSPQLTTPATPAATASAATSPQTVLSPISPTQTPVLQISGGFLLAATLLIGLILSLGLIFGFSQPFRCVLAYRLTEAVVAMIIALTGVGITAFSNLVSMQARQILRAIYGGIAIGLLVGIILAVISAQPDRTICGVFG